MAEARLAVGFQFAVSDEGVVVNLDKEILKLMANSAYKSVKRRCNDAKNTFLKGEFVKTNNCTINRGKFCKFLHLV